jgi:hypothetical protein
MNKEQLVNDLRSFYAKTKRQVNLGHSELVLEELFGIENIKNLVGEQFEEIYRHYFVTRKADLSKKELFSYSDIYDFINTLLNIDINDLMIFFTESEVLEFSISLMNVINRAFNNWAQNRMSGFRKGTRIYLEMDSTGIHLYLKPEIKT